MYVTVKWNNSHSSPIPIEKGIRLYLFNLVYKDLIEMLNLADCGITLDDTNYNAICYADDIILCSTTASGLQSDR